MARTTQRAAVARAEEAGGTPFASARDAWFWTMRCLIARRDGAQCRANLGAVRRPCEADDIVKVLDRLYRRKRIDLRQVRVLRVWGERQMAPDRDHPAEAGYWPIWQAALRALDAPLRAKGIVRAAMPRPIAVRTAAAERGARMVEH